MTCRGPGPRVVLALAVGLLATARAQDAAPDSLVEAVDVGFDGVATQRIPASLWVTLHNRRDRELDLTVVMKSAVGEAERAVTLPAASRKRVHLALTLEGQLLLEVREGGRVLETRTLAFALQDTVRHLLVLDGRPPDRRAGPQKEHEDQVLRFTTIDAGAAPAEAACYAGVAAVLLREVDPASLTADQLGALLEHVREGGLVLIAAATPKAPVTQRFFEGLPAGPTESLKVMGKPARVRRLGFGTVMAFADDPLAATLAGPRAADLKQRLGDLVDAATKVRRWPRPTDVLPPPLEDQPGVRTQLMVVGFLLVYLLAVGPVLGVAFRKARRRRVAVATLVLIGGFTLVAPLVAGVVRTGRGLARHRVVLWVPEEGPALELGEVRVVSGGATSYAVDLDGAGGPVAATLVEAVAAEDDRFQYTSLAGIAATGARPVAVRTARGERVALEVRMPLWGDQRIYTQTARPDVRRVQASVVRSAGGSVAMIHNDTGQTLLDCVIVEEAETGTPFAPYVHVGTIPRGERRDVLIPRSLGNRTPYLPELLDIPFDWSAWHDLGVPLGGPGRPQAARAARYRLVSRARARVRVGGSNLDAVTHALRLDPLNPGPPPARGFLGAALEDVEETVACVKCDAPLDARGDCGRCGTRARSQRRVRLTPLPGGPCARAGVQAGDVVLRLDGARIASGDQLRLLVRDRAPDEAVTLTLRGADDATREVRVVLARAPGGSE